MTQHTESTHCCILFADVAGSTKLYEKLGDAEARHAVERCLKRVRGAVEAFGGRVVKTIGDALMAEFPGVTPCIPAACQMQARVAELPPVGGLPMSIRVGFHVGPVLHEADGDLYGDTVNLAARLADIARGGQIITSASSLVGVSALVRQGTRDIDALSIKGKAMPIVLCEILWQGNGELTLAAPKSATGAHTAAVLTLRHDGVMITLGDSWDSLCLGRDPGCDIVIADRMASRQHARIERRGERLLLIDQSTNGTWLTPDGTPERLMRREEFVMQGRGRLCFGHPWSDGSECVEFDLASV